MNTASSKTIASDAPTTGQVATPHAPPPAMWKTYLIFLGPMIVSNILQALSGTINNI